MNKHGLNTMYDVILADPPWKYRNCNKKKVAGTTPYETMTLAQICELTIPAKDNSILFLWATIPMIPEALTVMTAWGFKYKSAWVWTKCNSKGTPRIGTGYWTRSSAELVLIGTRGSMYKWVKGKDMPGVFESIPEGHSRKPRIVHERVKYLLGNNENFRYLELFARPPFVGGWDVWGQEVSGYPDVLGQSESILESNSHGKEKSSVSTCRIVSRREELGQAEEVQCEERCTKRARGIQL